MSRRRALLLAACTWLLLCATSVGHGDTFLINNGETSTGTTTVQLTLSPDVPANIEAVFIGNSDDNLEPVSSPVYAPLSIPWNLSSGSGAKTVYVFYDYLGGGWSLATQGIFFSSIVNVAVASSGFDVCPRQTPFEYPGQEAFGPGRQATTTTGVGKALQFKK